MVEGKLDQINEHFALATGLLEDAHEIAVTGQSSRLSLEALREQAKALRQAVDRTSEMVTVIESLVS